MNKKPLGRKSYGSIPHLPGSRMGPADHKCSDGQLRIATEKKRDKHDTIIFQEKVDGSNVGVAKIDGQIIPITRAGYTALSSPYEQHHKFHEWVMKNLNRFHGFLVNGQRACGEWMIQAHGTRYNLPHEPFVLFDVMVGSERFRYEILKYVADQFDFIMPFTHSVGPEVSIEKALEYISKSEHGAIDPVEGGIWRVERNKIINQSTGERRHVVDYLVKYVRPNKKDGIYLSGISGKPDVFNKIYSFINKGD